MQTETITISMEYYNELLITKGKYEELKSQQTKQIDWNPRVVPLSTPTIYEEKKTPLDFTTITCSEEKNIK